MSEQDEVRNATPRETPLTDAAELRCIAVGSWYDLRVCSESLERTVAELREYAGHKHHCARCQQMPMVSGQQYNFPHDWLAWQKTIECTCGLDAILARLDGSKP